MHSSNYTISVGARASPLSRKQVDEVEREIARFYPGILFNTSWIVTSGDIDKTTPLTDSVPPNFFTKEIEERQILGEFRISIHSAKDLPKKLKEGLVIVAITHGIDQRDALVLPKGTTFEMLGEKSRIGTSSSRRENAMRVYLPNFISVPIRGTIEERIRLLDEKRVDALIMAEAAIIRLHLTFLNRMMLDTEPELLQGKLAILAKEEDLEMKALFSTIDSRVP